MYAPTQNGIEKSVRSVRYLEAKPPDSLAGLVHCFWELKTDTTLPDNFRYHVLPDACVDIVLHLLGAPMATITTPHTTSAVLNLGKTFHYVGIRFLPGVWRADLDKVVGGFIETPNIGSLPVVNINKELRKRAFTSQQALLADIVVELADEKLVMANHLMARILARIDTIHTVADMANIAAMSPRQLQRILRQTTGFSPHDLLKVLRMQRSFGQHYLASYVDQSHFIHSFRKITGFTPTKYAKKFDV